MPSTTANGRVPSGRKHKGKAAVAAGGDHGEWSTCTQCGKRVKTKNLPRHLKKIHGTSIVSEPPRGKNDGKWHKVVALLIVVTLLITAYLAFRNPGTKDDTGAPAQPDDQEPNDIGPTPHHPLGSGDDGWWTTYPDGHTSSGAEVGHPQWVLDELPNKPVVVLVYSNCSGCLRQKDAIQNVLKDYQENITFIGIRADGSDDRAVECENVYGTGFIPLTIMVTYIKEGNDIKIGWHSEEGQTGEDWIRAYMEDAIYYHEPVG